MTRNHKRNEPKPARVSAVEQIVHYLELKNQYYEKFHSMTRKFIESSQKDEWSDLQFFVENRERVLKIIQYFDHKVATLLQAVPSESPEVESHRARVQELMKARYDMGQRILEQDLELISRLEELKSETIRELKKVQDFGQKLHSYASTEGEPRPERRRAKAA